MRRLMGLLPFFNASENVFHDYDGVIHHQTSSQYNPQKGQNIDGKIEDVHDEKSAQQRDRNGNNRNQGSPPVAQKQENHQYHQAKG